jgi:membrane fusion protein (multidrug efflux system)
MAGATADASQAPGPERGRRYVREHRRLLIAIAAAVPVLAVGALLLLRYLASYESTDDAQVDGNVSTIGARIPGTVVAVHVEDNDRVAAGAPLVELDPADYHVALEQAEANLEQARSERVAAARANNTVAQLDAQRAARLLREQTIPRSDYDSHRATADARAADVRAGLAAVQGAQAALDQARLDVDYTRIGAPVAGVVGQKAVNVGDRVQPAQELLAIVQVDHLWITANYKETQLKHMAPGQRADVHVDAFDQTFHGRVESLGGASGARFSLLPPENATGNYVKVVQRLPVRIRLDAGQPGLDRLRPGMSVEPKVWLR